MKPVLVIIENEHTLDNADYVNHFKKSYTGEVVELTGFAHRSKEEIFLAVSKCTDIAVQTCFVNGSDDQLHGMVKLLSKIPFSINVYIAYLGISYQNELQKYLVDNIEPKDLLSIKQHNIYAMSRDKYNMDDEPHLLLDFTEATSKLVKEIADTKAYQDSARERTTGRKIKVLGTTAHSPAFDNLPIGEIVDELICDKLLSKGSKARGVWIWGNGEPIMLVNDHGYIEYEIATKLSTDEIINEISKQVDMSVKVEKLSPLEIEGLKHVIEDDDEDENSMSKANDICELLKIEKRKNRQAIYVLLQRNLEITV